LTAWNIKPSQVFLIITDNGSNMNKAVKVLNEALAAEKADNAVGTSAVYEK